MSSNPFLDAALAYHAQGLHPIPCRPGQKIPMVKWQQYQTVPPTRDQVEAWWRETPRANVALVLGRGLFAVDLDGGADAEGLLHDHGVALDLETPRSQTGSGYHVFYRADQDVPDRVALLSRDGGKPQVDIRGKGIVIAPPSIHPSGRAYEWIIPFDPAIVLPAPPALLDLIAKSDTIRFTNATDDGRDHRPESSDGWVRDALRGVGAGSRDATCTRLAGYLLSKGLPSDVVIALLNESFARRCSPPFDGVEKCVISIARREQLTGGSEVSVTPEHVGAVLDRVEAERLAGPAPALQTPYRVLNKLLSGGFAPGELIYVGARPGVGKTALALEVARVAGKAGKPVLIISREMRTAALARRILAQESLVSSTAIRQSSLTHDQVMRYQRAMDRLRDLPIWMTDRATSLAEIISALERVPMTPQLLVVDYLQLVRAPKSITDRRLQVEDVSKNLKALALQREIPVLCLSSLSRPPKDASVDREPTMADLRESGELEHDCDVALLLHRKFQATEATCIVAKNREGSTGKVPLVFAPEFVSFAALAEGEG